MASFYAQYPRPWKARVKRNGIEYFLGYFSTKQEAEEKEQKFAELYPSRRGSYQHV